MDRPLTPSGQRARYGPRDAGCGSRESSVASRETGSPKSEPSVEAAVPAKDSVGAAVPAPRTGGTPVPTEPSTGETLAATRPSRDSRLTTRDCCQARPGAVQKWRLKLHTSAG